MRSLTAARVGTLSIAPSTSTHMAAAAETTPRIILSSAGELGGWDARRAAKNPCERGEVYPSQRDNGEAGRRKRTDGKAITSAGCIFDSPNDLARSTRDRRALEPRNDAVAALRQDDVHRRPLPTQPRQGLQQRLLRPLGHVPLLLRPERLEQCPPFALVDEKPVELGPFEPRDLVPGEHRGGVEEGGEAAEAALIEEGAGVGEGDLVLEEEVGVGGSRGGWGEEEGKGRVVRAGEEDDRVVAGEG